MKPSTKGCLRLLLLVAAASSFSGCITAWTVLGMGKDLDRSVVDVKVWKLEKSLVLEATTESITQHAEFQ